MGWEAVEMAPPGTGLEELIDDEARASEAVHCAKPDPEARETGHRSIGWRRRRVAVRAVFW